MVKNVIREEEEVEEGFPAPQIFKKENGILWLRYQRDDRTILENTHQKDRGVAKQMLKIEPFQLRF